MTLKNCIVVFAFKKNKILRGTCKTPVICSYFTILVPSFSNCKLLQQNANQWTIYQTNQFLQFHLGRFWLPSRVCQEHHCRRELQTTQLKWENMQRVCRELLFGATSHHIAAYICICTFYVTSSHMCCY